MPDKVPSEFIYNLLGIISYTKEHTSHEINYIYKSGVRTDRNRNIMLEQAIERGMDYILWLDVDMLYPHNIIEKYMEKDFDIMGCLYFKRAGEFAPVGYVKGDNPSKPYKPLDPRLLPKDTVIEVDALGYGGMMVNMKLYEKMGEDKWTKYSDNFHLPYETVEPKFTHDILFCKTAQEQYGAQILLHTGIRPGHLTELPITQKEWEAARVEVRQPSIAVIMPTIHPEMSDKTMQILTTRAGMDFDKLIILDSERKGYVHMCNQFVKDRNRFDYYVYLTDDIFPSRNWLKDALDLLLKKGGKMVGFNDGKWKGMLATCALVESEWMRKNYNGNLFFPEYFGHYNDTELTMVAMQDKVYCYDPNISLFEVDYDKERKKVHPPDRELFMKRKETNFDGLITDEKLKQMFS